MHVITHYTPVQFFIVQIRTVTHNTAHTCSLYAHACLGCLVGQRTGAAYLALLFVGLRIRALQLGLDGTYFVDK